MTFSFGEKRCRKNLPLGDAVKPPPYVTLIQTDYIQLAGDVNTSRESLVELGMVDCPNARWRIPFDSSNVNAFEDEALIALVTRLCELNVCFGEDFKQLCSPAAYMRELRSRGILDSPFDCIVFRGPNNWFTTNTP